MIPIGLPLFIRREDDLNKSFNRAILEALGSNGGQDFEQLGIKEKNPKNFT